MKEDAQTPRAARGHVRAIFAELNPPGKRPFYRARLEANEIGRLCQFLAECGTGQRDWFTLAAIQPDLTRLSLTKSRTPKYELSAAKDYARGDVFRVSGKNQSCNIDFSGGEGAALLARILKSAQSRMRRFVELRVPSRSRNIVEFIPDTDLEAADSAEHCRLAMTGEALAGVVWDQEDFSDWDTADG